MDEKNMRELNMGEMDQISGGVNRVINTGKADLTASLRSGPSKGDRQIASLPNGMIVDTVTDQLEYDPISGRTFVKVRYTDKDGTKTGWVSSSVLGM